MLTASVSLKSRGFLICSKDMGNPHRNTKGSFSRIFGMTPVAIVAGAGTGPDPVFP